MSHLTSQQLKELKDKLFEEKAKLEKDLGSFAEKDPNMKGDWDSKFYDLDPGLQTEDELADEVEEYGNELAAEYPMEDQLKDVSDALARIETPDYGICIKCGKEIPFKRLQVVPEAKICIDCNE